MVSPLRPATVQGDFQPGSGENLKKTWGVVRPPRPPTTQGDFQPGSGENLRTKLGKAEGPPAAPSDGTGLLQTGQWRKHEENLREN